MKTILIALLTSAITGTAVYYYLQKQHELTSVDPGIIKLQTTHTFVEKRIKDIKEDISSRLLHFSKQIESDREFAMSLLAHNDRTAPAVTGAAVRFIKPMGFSVLEIVDSESVILSSGHFAANAGNNAAQKANALGNTVTVTNDKIMGEEVLTLQSKHSFSIADVPFAVMGGVIIDQAFLKSLLPHQDADVILRKGDFIKGMDIQSISPLENGKIIINDKEYHAASINLQCSGEEEVCELIVIVPTEN